MIGLSELQTLFTLTTIIYSMHQKQADQAVPERNFDECLQQRSLSLLHASSRNANAAFRSVSSGMSLVARNFHDQRATPRWPQLSSMSRLSDGTGRCGVFILELFIRGFFPILCDCQRHPGLPGCH